MLKNRRAFIVILDVILPILQLGQVTRVAAVSESLPARFRGAGYVMHLYRSAQGFGKFRGPVWLSQFLGERAYDHHFLEGGIVTRDVEKGGIDRVTKDALEIFRIAVIRVVS